jgi:hypothetical protein
LHFLLFKPLCLSLTLTLDTLSHPHPPFKHDSIPDPNKPDQEVCSCAPGWAGFTCKVKGLVVLVVVQVQKQTQRMRVCRPPFNTPLSCQHNTTTHTTPKYTHATQVPHRTCGNSTLACMNGARAGDEWGFAFAVEQRCVT